VTKKFRIGFRVLLATALTAAIAAGIYFYYLRPQYTEPGQLVSLLPRSDAVLFYANVQMLRTTGVLSSLEGAKSAQEPDYRRFVSKTGFAYERDLDAIAVASVPNQIFAVLLGRFDWKRLNEYAAKEGGTCRGSYCQVQNPKSGRCLSFFPIRSNLMAVAVSRDTNAAYALLPRRGAPAFAAPNYPAWVQIPKRVLDNPDSLPPAAQVFMRTLAPASEATFGVESAPDRPQNGFLVRMMAQYDSDKDAQNVSEHLTRVTRLLGSFASRSEPSKDGSAPADQGLRDLLASAAFIAGNRQVKGEWHISRSFLNSVLQ
jgi:hypothetical protein